MGTRPCARASAMALRGVDGIAAGGIGLSPAHEAVERMRRARQIVLRRRPRREDAQLAVDLHAVGIDDDAAEPLGELPAQGPTSRAGRRPGNKDGGRDRPCGTWIQLLPRRPQDQYGRAQSAVVLHGAQSMRIDAIAVGINPPDDVNVIIEVPIGGEPIKYEMDKAAGTLVVDRFLHTPMRYPGNYGFVPHTLSEDGDPIDVLVANTRPIVPGAVINVRPIGVLKMEDDAGGDEKILAVPVPKLTKRYERAMNYTDLPRDHAASRCSTSSSTTRTWSPASG